MALVIDDHATPEDLREAIIHLRARQRGAVIPSTAEEIGAEIDKLLDRLLEER